MAVAEKSEKLSQVEQLRSDLDYDRQPYFQQWKEAAEWISAKTQPYLQTNVKRGNRRNRNIIDSTGTTVIRTLASGMMGGMTSPAREWFKIQTADPRLMKSAAVREWCEEVTDLMRQTYTASNLYQRLPRVYESIGTYSIGAMMIEEDMEKVVRFTTFPIGSYYVGVDEKGKVCVFMRDMELTVRQLLKKFKQPGDESLSNFSEYVRNLVKEKKWDTRIQVSHVIAPNEEYDGVKSASKYKKFKSCYWERTASNTSGNNIVNGAGPTGFLRESGYDTFPVMVVRWQGEDEDAYGSECPGLLMLGDVKQLQIGEKRIMQAIEKVINPPMKGPEDLKSKAASLVPGGYTWLNEGATSGKFEPVHEIDPRITEMESKQEQCRARVRKAGFEDLFLMMTNDSRTQPPTAEEVIERRSEKMLTIGPVLQQVDDDLLDPLAALTFEMLQRQGWVPEPPPEMAGQPLRVEQVSVMAQAQKVLGVANKERFAKFVTSLAAETQNPALLDTVNFDNLVASYAESLGIEQKNLNTRAMMEELRAGREQAQQAMQQAQVAEQAALAAKNLSQADLGNGDSVLSRLAGQK